MGDHEAERVIKRPKGLAVAELIVPNGREARHSHREAGPQSSAFPVFGAPALLSPLYRLRVPAKIAPPCEGPAQSAPVARLLPLPRRFWRRCFRGVARSIR